MHSPWRALRKKGKRSGYGLTSTGQAAAVIGPDANTSSLAPRWRHGGGGDVHRDWPVRSLVPGRRTGENKTGTTLVDVALDTASDPGSIPGASTTVLNTKVPVLGGP